MADEHSREQHGAGEGGESAELEISGTAARANLKREPRAPQRSASHVRSGARMLSKEAQAILRRHRDRIDEHVVTEIEATLETIETLRAQKPNEDLGELEFQAEHLDELLHQHASFARKSALRDTLENIAIAVVVALAVRSCIYEPFKIPSGSMMPTLRAGDHIFVNKFSYGVQVPLTTTIVGKDWISEIERGDVIVFRFPLDESDDFIKRVIGLPGDTIRVNADRRQIELKRAGTEAYETIERTRLADVRCLAEQSSQVIENCTVYNEVLDGHSYQVRYRDDLRSNDPSMRTFVVPEDHLLVMGDNRNASHDSLAWTVSGDKVSAAGLLTRPDIRDLTDLDNERIQLHDDGDAVRSNDDGLRDGARYLAERDDPTRGLELEVWRAPPIAYQAVLESLAATHGADETVEFDALVEGLEVEPRVAEYGAKLGPMRFGQQDGQFELLFWSAEDEVVFRLHCGAKRCIRRGDVAKRAAMVLDAYAGNEQLDARELLASEYGRARTFPGRGQQDTRFIERQFGPAGKGVRLRAWRAPHEGLGHLRDAALAELGAGPLAERMAAHEIEAHERSALVDLGPDAWIVAHDRGWTVVHADEAHGVLAVLDCGPKRCKTQSDAVELAELVASRFADAQQDREQLVRLLGQSDVGALPETPIAERPGYYWDHLDISGKALDDSLSISVEIEQSPADGLGPAVEARQAALDGAEPVEGLGPGAVYADTPNGHTFVFAVPQTELVVQLSCRRGVCPDRATTRKLAERARDKALDPENYLQKGVSRPRPFVPRGNVKGRAEVIWWPTSRFWKNID